MTGFLDVSQEQYHADELGDTPTLSRSIICRFLARVDKTDENGCWLWTGALRETGYGRFTIDEYRRVQAHRFSYELHIGPIPDGLQLDHLCRVRHCVNPAHLEPVTARENTLRGETIAAFHARQTHCKRGHEFTPENTYVCGPDLRWRECRICRRNRSTAKEVA